MSARRSIALAGLLGLALTGCTDDGAPDGSESTATTSYQPFGKQCASVPPDYASRVDEPVSAAIAGEPLLSNLDVVLRQAGLTGPLDAAPALTVLAPVNAAFEVLPRDTYQLNLTEPRLQPLLDHHVIDTRLPVDQLADGQTTRNGDRVVFVPDDDTVSVPADNTLLRQVPAVICGTLETANATVHLVDQVLSPRA